jgi:hypothetical protein
MEIDSIIKNRKTEKVLADSQWSEELTNSEQELLINDLLHLAASAPYHHKCNSRFTQTGNELTSCLPFRFYSLDTSTCRKLSTIISEKQINAGKALQMLNAANIVFLVTWLPEVNSETSDEYSDQEPLPFIGNQKNMEHLAAASAAIQNVLIGSTSRGIPNYWSSGGALRKQPIRDLLSIPTDEIMLGALFFFPKDSSHRSANIVEGHLRNKGKELNTWSRPITIE